MFGIARLSECPGQITQHSYATFGTLDIAYQAENWIRLLFQYLRTLLGCHDEFLNLFVVRKLTQYVGKLFHRHQLRAAAINSFDEAKGSLQHFNGGIALARV